MDADNDVQDAPIEPERMGTADEPLRDSETTPRDKTVEVNTLMAILAYIGPLVFIPYLTTKNDPFVHFHVRQGFVVFIIWVIGVAISWLTPYMFPFGMITWLINLAVFVLAIVGIVHVVRKERTPLPVVGKYADSLNI